MIALALLVCFIVDVFSKLAPKYSKIKRSKTLMMPTETRYFFSYFIFLELFIFKLVFEADVNIFNLRVYTFNMCTKVFVLGLRR